VSVVRAVFDAGKDPNTGAWHYYLLAAIDGFM
jgi:hypothetical protein